jgi:uncharacterized protein (DUF885 family)
MSCIPGKYKLYYEEIYRGLSRFCLPRKIKEVITMNHRKRAMTLIMSAILILTILLVPGCGRGLPQDETTYETYTASSQQSQPSPVSLSEDDPKVLEARAAFEQFCDDLFKNQLSDDFLSLHYSLADPASYGLGDCPRTFGEFSLQGLKESAKLQKEQQAALASIPEEFLTQDQQLTYRVLEASFEAEEAFEGLELYYQPLAPTVGIQAQLPVLLAEYIFYSAQDVEDYLALLSTIDSYYQQLLEFEQEKSRAGLFMTDSCVDTITEDCQAYLLPPENNFLSATFDQRIDAMADLTDQEKADFKARNLTVLSEHFIPAYELLLNGLGDLKGTCTNEQGLCYYPEGKRYYEYLVHSSTGTNYDTIDKLRDAINNQINYDAAAMHKLLVDNPELGQQLDTYEFAYTEPGEILEHLKEVIQKDFPLLESASYTTKYVPEALEQTLSPAFFLVPPMDRYLDCVIYINNGSVSTSGDLYTTLAHEGYPGHLYQNVYFLSNCDSPVRNVLNFSSYSEGWATYVENYAYTTDNGLSPELGQLLAHNASATLALHAILDININYYGWSLDQVSSYLNETFGITERQVAEDIYQYMLRAPVNYLNYYVGYLELVLMKNQAEDTLKDRFVLKDFNQFILDIGPAPFTVIRPYFQEWLKAQAAAAGN